MHKRIVIEFTTGRMGFFFLFMCLCVREIVSSRLIRTKEKKDYDVQVLKHIDRLIELSVWRERTNVNPHKFATQATENTAMLGLCMQA